MDPQATPVPSGRPMRALMAAYAAELEANFRNLNIFVSDRLEIGRAHEILVSGWLRRLLPPAIAIDTGFVAYRNWTVSPQIDLLLHDEHRHAPLFRTGACAVVAWEALVAGIEVETDARSAKRFIQAYEQTLRILPQHRVLYIWHGLSLEKALDTLARYVSDDPLPRHEHVVDIIVVRKRFLLVRVGDGSFSHPAYGYYDLKKHKDGDGLALLLLAQWLYDRTRDLERPWWLEIDEVLPFDGVLEYPPATQTLLDTEHRRRLGNR